MRCVLAIVAFCLGCLGQALEPKSPIDESVVLEAHAAMTRGILYLVGHQQEDGSWAGHPGVTAACALALTTSGAKTEAVVAARNRGLDYIIGKVRADGSVRHEAGNDIYSGAMCLIALVTANRPGDAAVIEKVRGFLMASQLPRGYSYNQGFRYATATYPDLSNTHWALEALHLGEALKPDAAGVDAASRRLWHVAETLISHCQVGGDPAANAEAGGFTYYPLGVNGASRHAAETGNARVWGSLTCGAIKSLIYAGVKADDPRITAGLGWLSRHYSVKSNPGLGEGGLYYYWYMLVSMQVLLDRETIINAEGREVPWRRVVVEELLSRQQGDGRWVNERPLWMENTPELCTAYAVVTLAMAMGRR